MVMWDTNKFAKERDIHEQMGQPLELLDWNKNFHVLMDEFANMAIDNLLIA